MGWKTSQIFKEIHVKVYSTMYLNLILKYLCCKFNDLSPAGWKQLFRERDMNITDLQPAGVISRAADSPNSANRPYKMSKIATGDCDKNYQIKIYIN